MIRELSFDVPIRAVPGSNQKRGFVNPKTGRVIIADKAKGKHGYMAALRMFAAKTASEAGWEPATGPIVLHVDFVFTRPKGHFGTGKNAAVVKPSAPKHVTVKPDLTNLIKTTEDALTGIAWRDDSQIVGHETRKLFGVQDVVRIWVVEMGAK